MSTTMSAVNYAKSCAFLPDARVAGFLLDADIGDICFGTLHGTDRPFDDMFVRFEAVGLDNRNGYDLVKTADGVAYVIVGYSDHAKDRGVSHLQEHIRVNTDFYDARLLQTWANS